MPCGESAKIPSLSKRGWMIGEMSHGGKGDSSKVLDFVRADGQVWRRRWERCVQRGRGVDVILVS